MNLSAFDTVAGADQGAEMEIIGPHGKVIIDDETKQPWKIRLLGVDSKKYQEGQHRVGNKRIDRRARTRKGVKLEELEDDQLSVLLDVTTGWSGGIRINEGDPPLAFSRENARLVYTRFPWVREQAEDFIGERTNFLGESFRNSKSSPNGASS